MTWNPHAAEPGAAATVTEPPSGKDAAPIAETTPSVERPRPRPRSQRLTVVHGILAVALIIVTLQLWLLTATMNAYLGGDEGVLLPAALASLVCLALNGGLLWYLYGLER